MEALYRGHQFVVGTLAFNIVNHYGKHIGTNAGYAVVVTTSGTNTVRNNLQNVVAKIHGIRFVDGTKAVDIQKNYRECVIRLLGGHIHIHLQFFQEKLTIIDSGKSITISVELTIAFFLFVGACNRANYTDWSSLFVTLRPARNNNFRVSVFRHIQKPKLRRKGRIIL